MIIILKISYLNVNYMQLFWSINGPRFQKILTGGHINDGKQQVSIQQLTEINVKEIPQELLLYVH